MHLLLGVISFCMAAQANAEEPMHEFTDALGQKIKATLLYHNGSGRSVHIRREDGAEFDAPLANFSESDQTFVKEWIARTPPKLSYSFDYVFKRVNVGGDTVDHGYKRVRNSNYAYSIEVTNKSRDQVGPLRFEYCVFMRNVADGEFISFERGVKKIRGEFAQNEPLQFAQKTTFTTKSVGVDKVRYNYTYSTGPRYADALLGVILRVFDAQGNLIEETRSSESTAKSLAWSADE